MLKIHAIRTCYPHWSQHSGFHQFVQYLDPQYFKVDLQTASDSDDDFPVGNGVIRSLLRHQVQKHGMQWYKLSDLVAETKALKQCWTQKANIVHYFDGEHSAQYLPRLCKLFKSSTKIIATYHQPPALIDGLLDKKILSKLDQVTVVSPSQVSYFSNFVEPHKIHLILHGIDTKYFQLGKLPKEDGKFCCITVGRYLRDFKALYQVAKALISYHDIEFWVVSSNTSEVEDLPNVKVFQGIDDARLLQLYQSANALFLPLIDATANNALLEGMACGLPIISTQMSSIQAYLPNQEAILIQKNDPRKFVSAILDLLDNSSLCTSMGKRSRTRAEELDWRNTAKEYAQLYSETVASD